MDKLIRLSEKDIMEMVKRRLSLISEGVDWSYNPDTNTPNMSINTDTTDKRNRKGRLSADTRIFGKENDILNSDDTYAGEVSLKDKIEAGNEKVEFIQFVIRSLRSGDKESVIEGANQRISELQSKKNNTGASRLISSNIIFYRNIMNLVSGSDDDENTLRIISRKMQKIQSELSTYQTTAARIQQSDEPSERKTRYTTGTVVGTNVKFISLFSIKDFNFSDALKHGKMRPSQTVDKLMGREVRHKVPVTYDNGKRVNVAQNFSQNNVPDYHEKNQYRLKGSKYDTSEFGADDLQKELSKDSYTSINQYLDKSVMYAAYALKKENFSPSVIVSVPSSSKFNEYYCTNLSNKLGVEYIPNFFERNVLSVECEEGYRDKMIGDGFTEKEIAQFEDNIRRSVVKELLDYVYTPMKTFVRQNSEILSNMAYGNKGKAGIGNIEKSLMLYVYGYMRKAKGLKSRAFPVALSKLLQMSSGFDIKMAQNIVGAMLSMLKQKRLMRIFKSSWNETRNRIDKALKIMEEKGLKVGSLRGSEKAKITSFDKRFRPYISHFYVIAPQYTNEKGGLLSRFKKGNILIFDEDINSGASLKLTIEAIKDQEPSIPDNHLLCLVNAYSTGGR